MNIVARCRDHIELSGLQHLTTGSKTDIVDEHAADPFTSRIGRVNHGIPDRIHHQRQFNIALDAGADRSVVDDITHDDRARRTSARADAATSKRIADRRSPVGRLGHTHDAGNVEAICIQVDIGVALQRCSVIDLHQIVRFIERTGLQAGDRDKRPGKVVHPHFKLMFRQAQIPVRAGADEHIFGGPDKGVLVEHDPVRRRHISLGIAKRHSRDPECIGVGLQIDIGESIHLHLDLTVRSQHGALTDDDFAQHVPSVKPGIGPRPSQRAARDQFGLMPMHQRIEHHGLQLAIDIGGIHNTARAKAHTGSEIHGGQRIGAGARHKTASFAVDINPTLQPIGRVDVQSARSDNRIVTQFRRNGRVDGVACLRTRPGQNAKGCGVNLSIRVCQMRRRNQECADDVDSRFAP